jgi:hypothetical protein
MLIHLIYFNSCRLSYGIKKFWYHFQIADITDGSIQLTFFSAPSSHNSQTKTDLSRIDSFSMFHLFIINNIANAIGRSNLVHIFLISDGDKFNIIFLDGKVIPIFLNVHLILSLDSFIAASGSHMISMFGKDLLLSTSTVISYHSKPIFVMVFTLKIILIHI